MRYLILFIFVAGLSGCSLFPEEEDKTKSWSANRLYNTAKTAQQEGDHEQAIQFYEKLQARYPFGRYAQQAQIEQAYSYYRSQEPDSAIATLDRFVKQHPGHPHVSYAWYLKGLVNFNRGIGLLDKIIKHDDSQRDPGAALDSFQDFAVVVNRYPDSKYADDSRQRMLHLRNRLARYEVNVAEWYIRRGAWLAAARRGEYVVEKYQRTPAVADALSMMIAAYDELGLTDLSHDTRRVLAANYPEHPGNNEPGSREAYSVNKVWDWLGLDK